MKAMGLQPGMGRNALRPYKLPGRTENHAFPGLTDVLMRSML